MQSPSRLACALIFGMALLLSSAPARAQLVLPAGSVTPSLDVAVVPGPLAGADIRGTDRTPASDGPRDSLFRVVTGTYIAAAGADIAVSMYQIDRGVARERGLGAQWQDSPAAFAITKGALAATFVYGIHRMHERRPKTAIALGIAATALETLLTVRSARIGATIP